MAVTMTGISDVNRVLLNLEDARVANLAEKAMESMETGKVMSLAQIVSIVLAEAGTDLSAYALFKRVLATIVIKKLRIKTKSKDTPIFVHLVNTFCGRYKTYVKNYAQYGSCQAPKAPKSTDSVCSESKESAPSSPLVNKMKIIEDDDDEIEFMGDDEVTVEFKAAPAPTPKKREKETSSKRKLADLESENAQLRLKIQHLEMENAKLKEKKNEMKIAMTDFSKALYNLTKFKEY